MLTEDERIFLHELAKAQLTHFQKEKVKIDVPLPFLDTEEKYETFLKQLVKKLDR